MALALAALIAANAGNSRAQTMQTSGTGYEAQATAQEIKPVLFQNADKALATAREESADLLAPKAFDEGLKRYLEAEKRFERGEKLAAICAELNAALAAFQKARDAVKIARAAFAPVLAARAEAQKAGAPQFATTQWRNAEEKLRKTARTLENGNLNEAKKNIVAAENLYRQAEREAVVQNPLAQKRRRPSEEVSEPLPLVEKPVDASEENSAAIIALKQKVEELEQALKSKNSVSFQREPQAAPRLEIHALLQQLFNKNEGIVLKRGNDIVIRLYGLDDVEQAAYTEIRDLHLLEKVRQAINMVPAKHITIAGHAYLYRSVSDNLKHSREKAEAVKRYLKGNFSGARPAIVAIGYGDTNPIANGSLNNGNLGNNRIDIIIHLGKGKTS